jgi:hypothetical protein
VKKIDINKLNEPLKEPCVVIDKEEPTSVYDANMDTNMDTNMGANQSTNIADLPQPQNDDNVEISG